jgi:hypothetical protein
MTKPARDANPRWPGFLLAALVAVLVTLFGAGTASAAAATAAQTRVGAHTLIAHVLVGPQRGIGAGQRLGNDLPAYDFALATGVAAKAEEGAVRVSISRSRFPESAAHIEDAQAAGQSSRLTIDRAGAAARRAESMRGNPRVRGFDRDEYPPAMTSEGGAGSSVRPISPGDNRGAGACIGWQCRGLPDGSSIDLGVDP